VSIGDVFTVALKRGALAADYYSFSATTATIADALAGLAAAVDTTKYVATADSASATLTVVNKGADTLTLSVDRGSARDMSAWAAAIVVGDTGPNIATGDTIEVTVSYGVSGTKTYSTTLGTMTGNSAARQAAAAAAIATTINADPGALFYADVEAGSNRINIFSASTTDGTTAITSVVGSVVTGNATVSAVTNATRSVQFTGTAAAGKVWTIGLPNATSGTDYYSFAATTTSLADVVTGLVAAINASTVASGFSAVDSSHNSGAVPSLTITRNSATAFTASVANPVASLADASGWTETLKLSGAVATNTTATG
jgi:hypothetical protein